MKSFRSKCIVCGSGVKESREEDFRPKYHLAVTRFNCGATLVDDYTTNGTTGRVVLSGCTAEHPDDEWVLNYEKTR